MRHRLRAACVPQNKSARARSSENLKVIKYLLIDFILTVFSITGSWREYCPCKQLCSAVSIAQRGVVGVSWHCKLCLSPHSEIHIVCGKADKQLRGMKVNCTALQFQPHKFLPVAVLPQEQKDRARKNCLCCYCSSLWVGFHLHSYAMITGACTCTAKPNKEMYMLIQCFFPLTPLDYSCILLWWA